jgi:hypothetical protein
MAHPMKHSIAPHSLSMTFHTCDYCGQEETRVYAVHHNIGIKSCDEHYKLAKRDCNAYLHSTNRVRLLEKNSDINKFRFKMQGTFSVKRSSGILEDGWQLREEGFIDPLYIAKVDGDWTFPCCMPIKGITKQVSFKDMTHILEQTYIDSILDVLEKGVYMKDYIASGVQEKHEEPVFVKTVLVDGVEVRIFDPFNNQ